jgi:adenylosuccinate synthase
MSRFIITAGLSFGDEGKGSIVDFLCRYYSAAAVVRYNGGPQAAHHVVLKDGRWHCFSQFGSGAFVPGVRSHLSRQMLIKPSNLLVERDALKAKGCADALQRLSFDTRAHLVTPWHGLIGQLKELARGALRHGSVGMGVGEAAFDRREDQGALVVSDLGDAKLLASKLERHCAQKLETARALLKETAHGEAQALLRSFVSENDPARLLSFYRDFGQSCASNFQSDQLFLEEQLRQGSTIVFEGAQGALLDVRHGFRPYVTKTDATFSPAAELLRSSKGEDISVTKVGILRAYATRHGAGPLPTYDAGLSRALNEAHNRTNPWQGEFKAGWFDALMSRYALRISGGVDYLALTCLDRLSGRRPVKVCTSYEFRGNTGDLAEYFDCECHAGKARIFAIKPQPTAEKQARLTELILKCTPAEYREFEGWESLQGVKGFEALPRSLTRFIDYLESDRGLKTPVGIVSMGPTAEDKFTR